MSSVFKQQIVMITKNIEDIRLHKEVLEYKTVLDALVKLIDLGAYDFSSDEGFRCLTLDVVNYELKEVNKLAKESFCNKRYKEYYHWIQAIDNLNSMEDILASTPIKL
ncbi:hypothetical protein [Brevibacillus sp. NRS-1366]|uniref:hypothetical protein n=1 Tax=Brevibacillus sp. NRS-1366 TaxID=3233899 RepID=UPI003D1F2243